MRKIEALVIIFIIVVIGVGGFLYWEREKKLSQDICTTFEVIEKEISCQEARSIVLQEYPGAVTRITKSTLVVLVGRDPENSVNEERDAWIIQIRPDNISFLPQLPEGPEGGPPLIVEKIGVAVDRQNGKVLFLETITNDE